MLPPELPRIAVVIAAYNDKDRVLAALGSAFAQEGAEVSVIVADDASQDGTGAAVAQLVAQTPVQSQAQTQAQPQAQSQALSLVQAPINLGPGGARNLALEAVLQEGLGDWIAVLDSDDAFLPGRLARMQGHALAQGADIVIDDFISVDGAGAVLPGPRLADQRPPGVLDLADWLQLNDMAQGGLSFGYAKPLISRGFLERHGLRYNEALRNGEDFHLILEALAAGARLYFTGEAGYRYTRRAGSVSRRAQGAHMQALMDADRALAARLTPQQAAETAGVRAVRARNLQNLMITEEVMSALKSRDLAQAVTRLARHPGALGRVIGHLGEALRKRIGIRGGA